MKITRNVILDLLPLYLANEASEDTSALVKEYLENDPELADIAKKSATTELPGDTPVPLTREDEMEAYKEAKRLMFQRIIVLAAIISASVILIALVAVVAYFFFKG
jgi:predicted anti-sigma-YlaC factor YlaD